MILLVRDFSMGADNQFSSEFRFLTKQSDFLVSKAANKEVEALLFLSVISVKDVRIYFDNQATVVLMNAHKL